MGHLLGKTETAGATRQLANCGSARTRARSRPRTPTCRCGKAASASTLLRHLGPPDHVASVEGDVEAGVSRLPASARGAPGSPCPRPRSSSSRACRFRSPSTAPRVDRRREGRRGRRAPRRHRPHRVPGDRLPQRVKNRLAAAELLSPRTKRSSSCGAVSPDPGTKARAHATRYRACLPALSGREGTVQEISPPKGHLPGQGPMVMRMQPRFGMLSPGGDGGRARPTGRAASCSKPRTEPIGR